MLMIMDNFTNECPVIEVDTSINGIRVSRVLEWLGMKRGLFKLITMDNSPEFRNMALDRWDGINLDFIRPGKPVANAFIDHSTEDSDRNA